MAPDEVPFTGLTAKRRSVSRIPPKIKIRIISRRRHNDEFKDTHLLHPKSTFLFAILQFYSRFLVVPFNMSVHEGEDSFNVELIPKRKITRLGCFLIHSLEQLFLFYYIEDAIAKISQRVEAWSVLAVVQHGFGMLTHLIFCYVITFRQEEIQDLINKLENSKFSRYDTATPRTCFIWKLFRGPNALILWAFLALLSTSLINSFRRHVTWIITQLVFPDSLLELATLRYFSFTLVFLLGKLGSAVELFLLASSLSMVQVAREFDDQMGTLMSPQQIMEAFRELKHEFSSFNQIYSNLFLSHYICILLTYVGTPAFLNKMGASLEQAILGRFIYVAIHTGIYLGSCEIHRLVKSSVTDWIYEGKTRKEITHNEMIKLSILAAEVENHPVGITCSNFFVISYGIMGSFIGVIATYAIFAWQMQAHGTV